jgi:hypothetical protein
MAPKNRRLNSSHSKGTGVRFVVDQGFQPEPQVGSVVEPVENKITENRNHGFRERDIAAMTETVQEQQLFSTTRMQASVLADESSNLKHTHQPQPQLPEQSAPRSSASSSTGSHLSEQSSKSDDSVRAHLSTNAPQRLRSARHTEEEISVQQHELRKAQVNRMMEEQERVDDVRGDRRYEQYQRHVNEREKRGILESERDQSYQQARPMRRQAYGKNQRKQEGLTNKEKKRKTKVKKEYLLDLEYEMDLERGRWVRRGLYIDGKKPPGRERVIQTLNPWRLLRRTEVWQKMSRHLFAHL